MLSSDNFAAVQFALLKDNLPQYFLLVGTRVTQNGFIQLHVTGTEEHGLKITIDGVLQPNKSGFYLDGIFTASIRGARHIEHIVLKLGKNTNSPETKWPLLEMGINGIRDRMTLNQSLSENEHLLSEPTEWIGGVPVPSRFDVKMMVKLDGNNRKKIDGTLLLDKIEGLTEPTVGIFLAPKGPFSSVWRISKSAITPGQHSRPSINMTTNSGHIRALITSSPPFGEISWVTQSPEHPNDDLQVLVEEGVIDIQLDKEGKKFSGTINAKGKVLADNRPVTTFSAELSGKQQGRDLVESIARYVGARPFDGRWHDSRFGEITLRQEHDRVSGEFAGGTIEEGIVTGSTVTLHWKTSSGELRKGFLSSASDGVLIGMIWNENKNPAFDLLVAVQKVLPTGKMDSKNNQVFDVNSEEEAQELKSLAYDLVASGKNREATKILLKVIEYYHSCEVAAKNNPPDYKKLRNSLVSQVIPLYNLFNCATENGDYLVLIEALKRALQVQRELEKSKTNPQDFHEQEEKYIAKLNKSTEQFEKIKDRFDKAVTALSVSGIGISFDEESKAQGIKISGVRSNMPAGRAGVAIGDFIVSIDGTSVDGMSTERASMLLRGTAGSSLIIRLSRNGNYRDVTLVRAPLIDISSEERDKQIKSIGALRDNTANLCKYFRDEANKLNQFSKEATDVPLAFHKLTGSIEEHQRFVENQRKMAISLAENLLAESPTALDLFKRFISLTNVMARERKMDEETTVRMLKLDQEEDAFEKNPAVSVLDKESLALSILLVSEFTNMKETTGSSLQLVNKVAEFASHSPDAVKTSSVLVGLAGRLDTWRARMITDTAKIESLNLGQDFYADYVQALVEMNLPEEALKASESARARAFADLLASKQKMQVNINPAANSKGFLLSPANASPLSVQEIKDIAAAQGGTLVEYFLMDDSIAIWTITSKGKIDVIRVPIENMKKLNANIDRLADLMGRALSGEAGRKFRPEAANLLRWLNDRLIMPLEKRNMLPDDTTTVVTVIPHKSLFGIPFAALCDDNNRYFVEKHTLSYATALSVLKYTQQQQNRNTSKEHQRYLLALVSPDPLPNSEKLPNIPLSLLPDTADLFSKHILGFYAPEDIKDVYFGRNVTESTLREKAVNADVLYFATHAEVNETEPFKSFIALAKTNQFSGYFRVADIYGLNLKAELAILAACETGGGRVSGDGVDGLNRAFIQAGASTLLMSLWEIPEEKTTFAMIGFHKYWLQKKMGKAAALRYAQLELSNNYPNQPNVWAGFVLFGNPN
ncbi:MAG TPA: CHAT domain-containing protein [Desulfosporosinus sp.]|nr:CHAT domain-containing protein [Desulfosporosinus sp.]